MNTQVTGEVRGTITDTQGEALPGVTVTLSKGEQPHVEVSDARGQFRFAFVPVGVYELTASLEGFSVYDRKNIQVPVGRTIVIDPVLTPERGV